MGRVVYTSNFSHRTTFNCHIKANTPAFQKTYLSQKNCQFSSSKREIENCRIKITHIDEAYSHLLWFCITTLRDWLKTFTPFFHPIRSEAQPNRDSLAHVRNMYLLRVLIGSGDGRCPLRIYLLDSQKAFHVLRSAQTSTASHSLHSPRIINKRHVIYKLIHQLFKFTP